MDVLDAKNKKVARTFAAVVRDALEQGKAVDVPDFGHFYVQHQPAQIEQQPGGQLILQPPRDMVRFEPSS